MAVSPTPEDEWVLVLELYNDELTIFSSEPNHNNSNRHQVYAILEETPEELDTDNNPVINPLNLRRGAKHMEKEKLKQPSLPGKQFD
jgi:hypothetical protein